MDRGAHDRHRRLDIAAAVCQHRQHGELRLARCQVVIGHLGDALRADHTRSKAIPAAEIDRLASPPRSRRVGSHDCYDERTLVAGARGDGIERPGEQLASVGLELDLADGPKHRLVLVVNEIDEQHDSVGVVLDRYELIERSFREPCLGKIRNLNVQ